MWQWRQIFEGPMPGPTRISGRAQQVQIPPCEAPAAMPTDDFVLLLEGALRKLNNPAALGASPLAVHLARSLGASLALVAGERAADMSPLARAGVLREVIVEAMRRLSPVANGRELYAGPRALPFDVLAQEYLQEIPTKVISMRRGISESTLYRYRREAIRILAWQLLWQEERARRHAARDGVFSQ